MDEYFRFANIYDPLVGPFLKPIHRAMLAAISARQSRKVIDLCCGTGTLAGMVSDAGMKSVGVDISPSMLHVAREKHPTATFIDGDASSLIFQDEMFDAATVSFGLHEKPDDLAVSIMAEAYRVIRPGGLILVADYRQPFPAQSQWMGYAIALVERLAGKGHYDNYRTFMTTGGIESFMGRLGLVGLPAMTFMHGWVGLYINLK